MRIRGYNHIKKPITVVEGINFIPKELQNGCNPRYVYLSENNPSIDELVQMYARLTDVRDAAWVVSEDVFQHLLDLKDSDRQFLLHNKRMFNCPVFVDRALEGTSCSIAIGDRKKMIERVNADTNIEVGSLFIDDFGDIYVYKVDLFDHKGQLIDLSNKTRIKTITQDSSIPTSEWIENRLGSPLEEGKNYFPCSKYSIELVKNEEIKW